VPPCLAAVKVYATHGELCDALRDVFGVHTPDSQLTGV
jgi:methylmalonyl-CoA mutase N-terminal domain/subunit